MGENKVDIKRLMCGEWRAIFSDCGVQKKYVNSGAQFGDAISYAAMGSIVGFEEMRDSWTAWEKEYSLRGYKTISLDAFVEFGGYGVKIDHLLGQKREKDEKPILHAQIYMQKYLGVQPTPVINLEKVMRGQIQSGTFETPSTEE